MPHAHEDTNGGGVLIPTFMIVLCFTSFFCTAQHINLRRGSETFTIGPQAEVTLFTENKGLRNDSIEMMVRGKVIDIRNDVILLEYEEFAIHNFYRSAADSLHYVDEVLRDTVMLMKVPMNDVTGLYMHRKKLTTAMTKIVFVTLGTSLATVPLLLTLKPGPAKNAVTALNISSTVTMLAAAGIGIFFAKKKFWIKPKDRKSWELSPG
jgi:hypothetical protein